MERRQFLKGLAAVPFLPRLVRGISWTAAPAGPYSAVVPAGSILPFAGAHVPPGFLPCDGRAVPVLAYRRLNEAIGKSYGGGRGLLRTPDLRKRANPGDRHGTLSGGLRAAQERPLVEPVEIRWVIRT